MRLGTNEAGIEAYAVYPVPNVPATQCTNACPHGGELTATCACRCAAFRSGTACGVCTPVCENGGVADPVGCRCLCPHGYFGARCEQYAMFQWGPGGIVQGNSKGTFSWKIADWHEGAEFVRYADSVGSQAYGSAVVQATSGEATGTATIDINLYAHAPGYPRAWFYRMRVHMGLDQFGRPRPARVLALPAAFHDEAGLCRYGGNAPAADVPGVCAKPCEQTAWENSGSCSQACGTGQQTQIRSTARPAFGAGAACGPLVRTVDCNTQPCGQAVDRDCQGTWSACTGACETAGQRAFTQTQAQQVDASHGAV